MDEHVPNPNPPDWTEEDFKKYVVFSTNCPMCQYKVMYYQLRKLAENIDELGVQEGPAFEHLTMQLAYQQQQLVELGLFIASGVDDAKAFEKTKMLN